MLHHQGLHILVLMLLFISTFSYYSTNHHNHHIQYHHIQYQHNKNHNDYSINEIPQTYQQKISSSYLSSSKKLITISSFISLLQSSKVNAAITTRGINDNHHYCCL